MVDHGLTVAWACVALVAVSAAQSYFNALGAPDQRHDKGDHGGDQQQVYQPL
jgi:hypothetical protein